MKIVTFAHSDQPGGAQTMLSTLECVLRELGHEVTHVDRSAQEPDIRPDLVISNTVTVSRGIDFARDRSAAHLWYVHELGQGCVAGRSVAVSKAVAREQAAATVIHNCVQTNGVPARNIRDGYVLSVGGVCPRKDQITFIRAAHRVRKEMPTVRFANIGGCWDRAYWKKMFRIRKRMGIGRHDCPMIGHTEDLTDHYRAANVFVATAQAEPFGLAILEAMSHGVPVVSTRSGGPEEIVIDGETGFLVPVGDHRTIAARVTYLLQHPEEAIRMGEAGYERAKREFSRARYAEQWDQLLRSS